MKHWLKRFHHPLRTVSIEPTNHCNLHCSFCTSKRSKGYMTIELYKKIINQLHPRISLALSFGGESGLHPDFEWMVRYASKKQFRNLSLYTNGYTLNKFYKVLEECNVKTFLNPRISHKKIEHKDLVTNIHLEPTFPLITEDFNFVDLHGWKPNQTFSFCHFLFSYIAILWNGKVTICCRDLNGHKIIGDVNEQQIKDIWNNARYQELRKIGHCRDCHVWNHSFVHVEK